MNPLALAVAPFLLFLFLSLLDPSTPSQVSLSVTPTALARSGDPIRIQWSGIASPSELDWLGIYSPPDSPHDHFIGYTFLSSSPTWRSGSGSSSLPLVNLRSNYSFRIFHWAKSEVDPKRHDQDHNPLPGTAHLLAESKGVGFASGSRPEQIHLAFTDNEDEMRVMFVTGRGDERQYVRYGERKDRLDGVAEARVGRYELEHMCESPANASVGWRDPGWIHDGVIRKLKKGVRYYYQVNNLVDYLSD
jgi:hypothetical protein